MMNVLLFLTNDTKQDASILNLQRACEASIDLAMHTISELDLGVPQSSRDAFDRLCQHGLIDQELNRKMKAMVGFCNIAVHDYQTIQINVLNTIITDHLEDFLLFTEKVKAYHFK
jgi:uncharacterized protein YutE (UPF0331/DUF86 family)